MQYPDGVHKSGNRGVRKLTIKGAEILDGRTTLCTIANDLLINGCASLKKNTSKPLDKESDKGKL